MRGTRLASILARCRALALLGAHGQAAETTIQTGMIGAPNAVGWPWYIGIDKGFFAASGIKLDLIYVPTASGLVQQLAAGSLDIVADVGVVEPIHAVERGAPVAHHAHRRPGFALRTAGQADHRIDQGPQGQDHLHRRPARHQPRLSRAHHEGQRACTMATTTSRSSATPPDASPRSSRARPTPPCWRRRLISLPRTRASAISAGSRLCGRPAVFGHRRVARLCARATRYADKAARRARQKRRLVQRPGQSQRSGRHSGAADEVAAPAGRAKLRLSAQDRLFRAATTTCRARACRM